MNKKENWTGLWRPYIFTQLVIMNCLGMSLINSVCDCVANVPITLGIHYYIKHTDRIIRLLIS